MIINRYPVGTGKRKRDVYEVCADANETGSTPKAIARFDTLEIATAVMRYMRGDELALVDEAIAKEAIKNVDKKEVATPAVESKGSH